MDFLLECIGFPPDQPHEPLVERVLAQGEPDPWRGPAERHRKVALGGGLELRLDRDPEDRYWSLTPHFRVDHRLRVAVESIRRVPDSPFDALLVGWAAPPLEPAPRGAPPGAYRLATWLGDARRLPPELPPGHVLAVSVAGFALDVTYVGPNAGVRDPSVLERESGAWIQPLGAPDEPGGCAEVSLRVRAVRHLVNPWTRVPVELVEADAPGRPLQLFLSRWQLEGDSLPTPRPGWRVEGSFLFHGRLAGGVPRPAPRARGSFG